MKSIFRIYAKTSKGNDSYLYNQLLSFGLKPKHEDLLHSFYFNANFNQLFKLSFQSFTVENLYLQIGHKYPLSTTRGEAQKSLAQFFKKTNFRNYIRLQKGLIQNISLKILIRQSSTHLPSENAIVSILQNCLQKQIIMKQYRSMNQGQEVNRLQNYYDIKHIVQKKWQHENILKQQKKLQLENKNATKALLTSNSDTTKNKNTNTDIKVQNNTENQTQITPQPNISYSPNFILYIRRNHARILLKLNRQSMHKFGWKKNVGWAPIRQTLTASILYRSGLIEHFRTSNSVNLCDPFCGSSTIPMVALSILAGLKIRQDYKQNFIWQNWPIYRQQYLTQYLQQKQKQIKNLKISILASDVDIAAVQNSVNNFKQFVFQNKDKINSISKSEPFLNYGFADKIFEICPNTIYIGCSDFQKILQKYNKNHKINIMTNLPYLGQRSKQHHPIKQLNSIYKRFNQMISKNKQNIDNVFVIVDGDVNNQNHFLRISKQKWTILDRFNNGGLQVCLLAWQGNKIGWKSIQIYDQNTNKGAIAYDQAKKQNLIQYRQKIKQLSKKQYDIPEHFKKYKGLSGFRRVQAKRKARQLRAAYVAFAQKKDKNQTYQKYAKKNLALRLSQRGKTWKRKNISLIQNDLEGKQQLIKKQFQSRIEEALKRSQELKQRKKPIKERVKRRW